MTRHFAALLGALVAAVTLSLPAARAEAPPASAGPIDPAVIEDLVAANRILADQGVLDAFGHVSIRHPKDPNRYLMSRSLAPQLVTADDIMEYDLDSKPVDQKGRAMFLERFIHGEIYKARPDVKAVVHSHSPSVIPFGVTKVPMRPLYHMSAFLYAGVPIFEIRKAGGMTNMLVGSAPLGKALAETLGDKSVALMRGHGNVIVGPTVQIAVFRAVYTEVNARLQIQALTLGAGDVVYLDPEEGKKVEPVIQQVGGRAWDLWKRKVMAKP